MHIQKTSGSSINYILKCQKKHMWASYKKGKDLPDILSGHVPYGIHNDFDLKEDEVRYFTFLREPISRWKSQFYHCVSNHKSTGYLIFEESNFSLEKFLKLCLKYEHGSNLMTKQIAGTEDISNIKREKNDPANKKYFGYYQMYSWGSRIKKNSEKDMEKMLELAKYNIINKFEFVGFQERANEDYLELCKKFKFNHPKKNIYLRKRNISKGKRRKFNFREPNIREMLLKLNKYDISLYDYACDNLWRKNQA